MGLRKWLPGLLIAASISAHGSDFGFESLRQLIEEHSLDRIEDLLAALPEDLRRHYTLVFESRSLQGASFSNPRAILFGSHATLVVSFNGEPSERGYNVLETMEFDRGTQHFLFREIQFSGGSPQISAVNPPRCAACHGSSARPIWDTPPSWPGVYGQRYHAGLSASESRGIAAFLALQPDHRRYRALLGAKALADRSTYVPDSRAIYEASTVEPPNAQLSSLLTELNTRSILTEMAARPTFPAHRYALLAAAEGSCGRVTDFYPDHLQTELAMSRLALARDAAAAAARQGLSKGLRGTREAAVYRAGAAVEDMNDLRFVAESSLGIATAHWTLAFERGTYDLAAPDGTLSLQGALFEWVARSDPRIRDYRAYRGSEGHDRYCDFLRRESLHLLSDWYATHRLEAAVTSETSVSDPPGALPEIPSLLERCAACHTGDVAPLIPFTDRAQLARQLVQGQYRRGRLIDEILYRLDPLAGAEAMPRGISISPPQRQGLEQYFLDTASSATTW